MQEKTFSWNEDRPFRDDVMESENHYKILEIRSSLKRMLLDTSKPRALHTSLHLITTAIIQLMDELEDQCRHTNSDISNQQDS